ncbi:general substrate transporter [Pavlovales sp. CCMP2436]|nr:general substrate transporter [Pavlovales sp. CCMP2436]
MRSGMPGRGGLGTSVATAMLGYAMMGWAMGSMNSSALVMRAALGLGETEAYSDTVWGLLISIYGVGAMIGCSMSAQLADQLGRVAFVAITGILFVVAAALMTTAVLGGSAGIALMLVGRFLAGAASGGITVVMPAYLSEIAPIELRGALSISMQLVSVVSLLGVQVII